MVVFMESYSGIPDPQIASERSEWITATQVQDLILYEDALEATASGQEVLQLFQDKPLLPGILIVVAGEFAGMISRQRFYEHITSFPHSIDIFSQRSIRAVLEFFQEDILCIEGTTSILEASQLSLQRPSHRIYEPIVVKIQAEAGTRFQLLDVHQLLLAQSKIHERIARELHETRNGLHRLNRELEARVQHRTEQLQAFNAQLREEIERRHQLQEKLHAIAYFDPLTRLPNQTLLKEWLEDCLRRSQGQTTCCALMVMDCDHFRVVNESLGHARGDELLVAIAQRLQSHLRSQDLLCRVGEDEFVVVSDQVRDPQEIYELAKALQTIWALPFRLGSQEVFMTASMGIVFSSGDSTVAEMLRDADTAMYAAKAEKRGSIQVFEPAMHQRAQARLQMETDLRRGLDRGEFRVFYQPIIHLHSGTVAGFEALVRWQHPEQGLLSPAQFITAAEENGLIIPLGYWILQEATQQWQRWRDQFRIPLRMSVNLSVRQLLQTDLVHQTEQILAGIPRQDLVFELTESIFLENSQNLFDLLHALDTFKVQLCLDDFGTGYSCLSYLKKLPIHNLKIDRSFITDIIENPQSTGIVQTFITLADTLGMTVTAEGVETVAQAALLKKMGCNYGQGYLFARPLSAAAAEELLAAQTHWEL